MCSRKKAKCPVKCSLQLYDINQNRNCPTIICKILKLYESSAAFLFLYTRKQMDRLSNRVGCTTGIQKLLKLRCCVSVVEEYINGSIEM